MALLRDDINGAVSRADALEKKPRRRGRNVNRDAGRKPPDLCSLGDLRF
jgi:hypothetical protein